MKIILQFDKGSQYSQSSADEAVALKGGDDLEHVEEREVIVCHNTIGYRRISETYPCLCNIHYHSLMRKMVGVEIYKIIRHPQEDIRSLEFPLKTIVLTESNNVKVRELHCYEQQYVVDAYAAIEEQGLWLIRTNQAKLLI